jgi:(p)ppGpp synthase/HD superfamily hydrolase
MSDLASRRAEMRTLVVDAHAAQRRNGNRVPYAVHALSVGTIVEDALELGGECSDEALRHDLYLAAIGQDLYEDTPVARDKIRTRFGERVDRLIDGATHYPGQDRAAFLAKLREAPEEVRLVKLAALVDNATSCAYGIHDVTRASVATTLAPSMLEMYETLGRSTCHRFAKTERVLLGWADFAMRRLRAMLDVASAVDYLDGEHGN